MNAPQVLELPLDDSLLKVLSSESRREILRLLAERRMTGAEMATRLNLGKPAVSEHLKKLTEAGLIERQDDPERRWVYYNLSSRGKSILEPQRVRFYLVMAVASLALVLGMALALGAMVFLQSQGAGAAGALGQDDGAGAGGLGQMPGQIDAVAVPDASASPEASRPNDSATETNPPTEDASEVQAVTVVTGVMRIACPPGKVCGEETAATPDPDAFVLVLPNGALAPPLATHALYVYHPEDIDDVKHTITVQPILADEAGTIAMDLGEGANLTLDALASSETAIALSTGGALLPVATGIEVPELVGDFAATASDASATASEGDSAPTTNTATPDASASEGAAPDASQAPAPAAQATEAGTQGESGDASTATAPATQSDEVAATASAEPDAAAGQTNAATAEGAAATDDGAEGAPQSSTSNDPPAGAPNTTQPDSSAQTSTPDAASASSGQSIPQQETPTTRNALQGDGASEAAAPVGISGADEASATATSAAARAPGDSAFLPFVALLGAAVLAAVARRHL